MMQDVGSLIIIPIGGQPRQGSPPTRTGASRAQQAMCGTQATSSGSATTKVTRTSWDVDVGVDTD